MFWILKLGFFFVKCQFFNLLLYKLYIMITQLRQLSRWCSRHQKKALLLSVLSLLLLTGGGFYIGYTLYLEGILLTSFAFLSTMLLIFLIELCIKRFCYKNTAVRTFNQLTFRMRILTFSIYAYSAFLIAIFIGNLQFSNHWMTNGEAIEWVKESLSYEEHLSASVAYNVVPKSKKLKKKKKSKKFVFFNKIDRPHPEKTTMDYRGYIAIGIVFIFVAILSAIFACVSFCLASTVGYVLGVLCVLSFAGSIVLSTWAFRNARALRVEKKIKERNERRRPVRKVR